VIAYFDSSSIVKWFFDEPYAEVARSIKDETDAAFTSLVSYPEVLSSFNRAWKEGRCSKSDMELVQNEFIRIWRDFLWIKPNEKLILDTRELISKYGLRGFDSIHLASSLLLREQSNGMEIFFSCFDRTLNKAAKKEGLTIHDFFI